MKKRTGFKRFRIVVPLAGCFTLLLIVGMGSVSPVTGPISQSQARVLTIVPGLEIVDVERVSEHGYHVTIRNGYEMDVTAIAAQSNGGTTSYTSDFTISEVDGGDTLSPGESEMFPLSATRPGTDIIICAVVFKDGSSEGDQAEVKWILDGRRGEKIQLGRIKPHLERLARVGSGRIRAEFAKVKKIAECLPIETDDGSFMSSGLQSGLEHMRHIIVWLLSELEAELDNHRVDTLWVNGWLNGQPKTVVTTGYENFVNKYIRTKKRFTVWSSRL